MIFLVNQLLIFDLPKFYQFAIGAPITAHKLFGVGFHPEVGYHGALVLMTIVYGVSAVAMRCKRISVTPVSSAGIGADLLRRQ